jgi:hypothetical protein
MLHSKVCDFDLVPEDRRHCWTAPQTAEIVVPCWDQAEILQELGTMRDSMRKDVMHRLYNPPPASTGRKKRL